MRRHLGGSTYARLIPVYLFSAPSVCWPRRRPAAHSTSRMLRYRDRKNFATKSRTSCPYGRAGVCGDRRLPKVALWRIDVPNVGCTGCRNSSTLPSIGPRSSSTGGDRPRHTIAEHGARHDGGRSVRCVRLKRRPAGADNMNTIVVRLSSANYLPDHRIECRLSLSPILAAYKSAIQRRSNAKSVLASAHFNVSSGVQQTVLSGWALWQPSYQPR